MSEGVLGRNCKVFNAGLITIDSEVVLQIQYHNLISVILTIMALSCGHIVLLTVSRPMKIRLGMPVDISVLVGCPRLVFIL